MDVYVDESGDLGFSPKSSKFFVVAFIACDSSSGMKITMKRTLKRLHQKKKYHLSTDELKFSRMNEYSRKYTLERIAQMDMQIGVVVVEKKRILPKLKKDLTLLYNWIVVHNIMTALVPFLVTGQKMSIHFDKSMSKKRIQAFNEYVREKASYLFYTQGNKLPTNIITAHHIDSKLEPCLQAVDAVAGAYYQMYEHQNSAYVESIKEKVTSFTYLWPK